MACADQTKWNEGLHELFHPKPSSLRLGNEIDRGAYGAVYFAERDGEPVAVKRIHKLLIRGAGEKSEQEYLLKKFKKECSLLEEAKHPCIVTFYGAYYDEHTKEPLLVMERMSKNLRDYLKENKGELELPRIVDISLSIASALHYLHNLPEPIIHCDLNDKNIMLTVRGVVKVGDMGESRRKMAYKRYMYTANGGFGAIRFMPPEALQENNEGKFRYNEKIDSFSAGVLMLETATQTEPRGSYIGIGVTPEVQRREQDLAPLPDDHPMRNLILDCLENDWNRRPDARKLQSRLELIRIQHYISIDYSACASSDSPHQDRRFRTFSEFLTSEDLMSKVLMFFKNDLHNFLDDVPEEEDDLAYETVQEITMKLHKLCCNQLWILVNSQLHSKLVQDILKEHSIQVPMVSPTPAAEGIELFKESFEEVHCGHQERLDVRVSRMTIEAVLRAKEAAWIGSNLDLKQLHYALHGLLNYICLQKLNEVSVLRSNIVPEKMSELSSQIGTVVTSMLLHSSPILPLTGLKTFQPEFHEPTRSARQDTNGYSELVYRTPYLYFYHYGRLRTLHKASVSFAYPTMVESA